ncbi:MAG: RNA polymerase factor sigma-54 [Nitrospinota bacterium]|nr:RNA polymerase factor sigma-54 [Nitrospinota bacterium]
MGIELKLQMRQAQRLVMTPMLQQAIKLLPMTRLELVQAIRHELEQNPLLEEEETVEIAAEAGAEAGEEMTSDEAEVQPKEEVFEEQAALEEGKPQEKKDDVDWDSYMQNDLYEGRTGDGNTEFPSIENTLRQKESLEFHLMWQLSASALDDAEERLGELIIGNINMEGYLVETMENLAAEAGVDVETMEDALLLVQSFDPPGVGARNLKECLMLQMSNAKLKGSVVEKLIQDHLEELDEKNYKKIAKAMDITLDEIIDAMRVIKEFDPKPGLEYNPEEAVYITPDLYVVKMDNEYQVYLNDEDVPRLRINSYYQSILKNKAKDATQTREYVEGKFRSALWMIKSIEQRRQTMIKVGRSICKFQKEFMDNGLAHLKPLVLKDVAEDIGMHESTISRVTTNKYIHTPQGLYELKYFFHSSVGSMQGSDMSSVRVKDMIRMICKEEDAGKPYTDDQIVRMLEGKNVKIARRTVTKYRKELKIPSTSKRKRLFL